MEQRYEVFKHVTPKTLIVPIVALIILTAPVIYLILSACGVPVSLTIATVAGISFIGSAVTARNAYRVNYGGYLTDDGIYLHKSGNGIVIPWNRVTSVTKSSRDNTDENGDIATDFPFYRFDFMQYVVMYTVSANGTDYRLPPLADFNRYKEFERLFETKAGLHFSHTDGNGHRASEIWTK